MAIAFRILVQIGLVALLGLVEVPERLQFHHQGSAGFGFLFCVNALDAGLFGRVRVIDAGAVPRALVMSLPVQAKRVDDAEKQLCKFFQADALRVVGDPYRLGKAGGVCINLFVFGIGGISVGVSADGFLYSVHL